VFGRTRAGAAAVAALTIAAAAPAEAGRKPLPNLRQAWVSASASRVEAGASLRARDAVKNASRRKARRSAVGFYLSRDRRRSADDLHLAAFRRVPRLRPRRSSRGATHVGIPDSVAAGSYRLIACADPLDRIRERRERDNCAATKGTIEVVKPAATLLAAGDVADCGLEGDSATAALLAERAGTVAMLGDGAYPDGSPGEYADCYDPTWGRVKARTRPVPGDHDYGTPGAAGYFAYFGAAAGQPGRGWYSYELGEWHVVALNSVCAGVGCGPGSAQIRWLEDDLASHPARCTLAYWHNPVQSQGSEGGSGAMFTARDVLREAGAELALGGDNHDYERFPASGGLREFVVGTGGAKLHPFRSGEQSSEVRDARTHGVLRLTLRGDGYDWRFIPVAGGSFTDSGGGDCH
jgi:hypothetical protein